MGSGATGRVEQDLLITRSVSFNLLGGADGWSCTDSKNNKRVSAIRGIYLMCVCACVCVCDGQIGSARVTPEDEKTTRKGGNMKGRLKTNEKKRNEKEKSSISERKSVKIT